MMKKILKLIWDEFIYGGHLTALGAPSIAYLAARFSNQEFPIVLGVLLYTGAESIYLFDRINDLDKDENSNCERATHLRQKKTARMTFAVAFITVTIALPIVEKKYLFTCILLFMLFLGLLYSTYFKNLSSRITGFKNIFVSSMWMLTPILYLLYIYPDKVFRPGFYIAIAFIFLRELINPTFCDIKDMHSDKQLGIRTIANQLGKDQTISFLRIINLLSALPLMIGFMFNIIPAKYLILIILLIYTEYYLLYARKKMPIHSYVYTVIPDVEIVSYFLLLSVVTMHGL